MKRYIVLVLMAGMASAAYAHGGDDRDRMVLGGIFGGAIGAMIGHDAGGRDGAVLGGAIGAVAGMALESGQHRYDEYERVRYREPHGDGYREHRRGDVWHHGRRNRRRDGDD